MEALCQISLQAIRKNYEYFGKRAKSAKVIPVVKANAYGHGAVKVSQYLFQESGVETFAVATLEEAQVLAAALPEITILIFSRVFPAELPQVPSQAILTVGSLEDAQALNTVLDKKINVHLNINTGMNRLGVTEEEALRLIRDKESNLIISGVYSHFSSADTADMRVYMGQNTRFQSIVKKLRDAGFNGDVHLSNSAGALHDSQDFYNGMRLGIGLYGYDTSAEGLHQSKLEPAMQVKAPLIRVQRIQPGASVSYAEKWQATIATNIGTLRIGYADGYSRGLTNRGMVSYKGKMYPVVGTVTMDHIMIDLGDDVLDPGVIMTVMGGDMEPIKVNEISKMLNTIPYEICCAISARVKRQY